jgi:hypothetical protein
MRKPIIRRKGALILETSAEKQLTVSRFLCHCRNNLKAQSWTLEKKSMLDLSPPTPHFHIWKFLRGERRIAQAVSDWFQIIRYPLTANLRWRSWLPKLSFSYPNWWRQIDEAPCTFMPPESDGHHGS